MQASFLSRRSRTALPALLSLVLAACGGGGGADGTGTASGTDAGTASTGGTSAGSTSLPGGVTTQSLLTPALTTVKVVAQSETAAQIAADNAAAWPFTQPSMSTLHASPKKVFAHYLPTFPVSIDNRTPTFDYYQTQYLSPSGEGGKWGFCGGYVKERPMPRSVITSSDWSSIDMRTDVLRAASAGVDGFSLDILGTTGTPWTNAVRMMSVAASAAPNFRIMLMPDMNAEFKTSPQNMVPAIIALSAYSSAYRLPDGRLVLAPYNAQNQSVTWWKQQIAALSAAGVQVAFFPVFQGWQTYAADFAPISYGMSDWGVRSPGGNASWLSAASKAHAYNTLWMGPAAPQDSRPKSLLYFEAGNTANYRTMWENAINGGADWVQAITWNDYSESSEISPSTGGQSVFYDLTAWYVSWFKTGRAPAINKDVLYYTHRKQATNSPYNTALQPKPYVAGGGSDPASNQIEVVSFLTAPGQVEIAIGTKVYDFDAPAGMASFKVPMALGTPTFRLFRGGVNLIATQGAVQIVNGATYQDFLYRGGSSNRPIVIQ